jgi:hypothetical protein
MTLPTRILEQTLPGRASHQTGISPTISRSKLMLSSTNSVVASTGTAAKSATEKLPGRKAPMGTAARRKQEAQTGSHSRYEPPRPIRPSYVDSPPNDLYKSLTPRGPSPSPFQSPAQHRATKRGPSTRISATGPTSGAVSVTQSLPQISDRPQGRHVEKSGTSETSILTEPYKDGRTALHQAACDGNESAVVRLLKNRANDDIEEQDAKGRTPLRWSEKWPIFGPCAHYHQNSLYLHVNNLIKTAI